MTKIETITALIEARDNGADNQEQIDTLVAELEAEQVVEADDGFDYANTMARLG